MRIATGIEYCGVNYRGWQVQANANSVQAEVEAAVSKVADTPVRVTAAGRTDAGVHACAQVAHFEAPRSATRRRWLEGVNSNLPPDVSLLWSRRVSDDFHARFSAVERGYRYVILNRPARPSYLHGRVAWVPMPLDAAAMQRAAVALVGRHDFSAFRAAGCQSKDAHREVRYLQVHRRGDWVWLDIRADGFLQHMVRIIAGTLIRVGEGHARPEWTAQLLAAGERKVAGATASPAGLYFTGARYPPRYRIPAPPPPCKFW